MKKSFLVLSSFFVLTTSTVVFAAGGSDIGSSTNGVNRSTQNNSQKLAHTAQLPDLKCTGVGSGYLGPNMTYEVTVKDGIVKYADYVANNGGSVTFKKGLPIWTDGGVTVFGVPGALEIYLVDSRTATLKRFPYNVNGNKTDIPFYVQLSCQ